jgi:hypothetical protein
MFLNESINAAKYDHTQARMSQWYQTLSWTTVLISFDKNFSSLLTAHVDGRLAGVRE